MAKEKNSKARMTISIIAISLTVLGMVVAGVMAYGDTSNTGEVNAGAIEDHKESTSKGFEYLAKHFGKETSELKEDGCDPAQKNQTDIAVIETKLDTISAAQETKRVEDKAAFKEILERLPK